MRTNELEALEEEANAAYYQGDYGTTIAVLERVIEVRGRSHATAKRHGTFESGT